MKRWLSSSIVAGLLFFAANAAANPSARLVYVRGPGANECPDEDVVRKSVATRLGYDPFFLSAPTTIVVELSRAGERFAAVVKLVDSQGVERGTRHLESHTKNCAELVGTLALTISLVVDPLSLAVAPRPADTVPAEPPPAPPEPVAPTPPAATVTPAPEAPPPSIPQSPAAGPFFAGVTVLGSLGSALAPTAGAAIIGGFRRGWASIRVEARGDLPATAHAPPNARSWALFGSALPCGHLQFAFACASVGLEWIPHATADVASPRVAETVVAVVGGRLGLELEATDRLGFVAFAESLVPLPSPQIQVDHSSVLQFPAVAADVGLSALELF